MTAAGAESVTVGPVLVTVCAPQDGAARTAGICHQALVTVVYAHPAGAHPLQHAAGAIRERLRDVTGPDHPYPGAALEDVTRRLFAYLDGFMAWEWEAWGGAYMLRAVHLDPAGELDTWCTADRCTVERVD